jgi:hypothetical protein
MATWSVGISAVRRRQRQQEAAKVVGGLWAEKSKAQKGEKIGYVVLLSLFKTLLSFALNCKADKRKRRRVFILKSF